jgi:hypothetical protein
MRQKITTSLVTKLRCTAEKGQGWVLDTELSDLAVRITNNGINSVVFEKRRKDVAQVKQITMGRCGEWSL